MKMRKGNTLNENKIHNNTYLNNGYEILRSASSFFQYGLYTNLSLSTYIRPVYLFHPKRYDSMNFAISILQQGYIGIQTFCNSRYKYFFFAKYLCSFAIVLIVVNTNIFVMISNTFETYHLWVDTENHVFENILIEMIGYNKNGFVK